MSLELTYEELQACYWALDARESDLLQRLTAYNLGLMSAAASAKAEVWGQLEATRHAASKVRAEITRVDREGK